MMNSKYDHVMEVIKTLKDNGYQAYIVGGAVRDKLMNKIPLDYDVATSALPDEIEVLFKRTLPVGKQFGVILVVFGGETIEVATFRKDGDYLDGRRPLSVTFCDAREDVLRRDFTINGLLYDPLNNEVIDWVDGRRDIEGKVIRCIGDPEQRFSEDKLRMLRAIRFSSNLNFSIERDTWSALINLKHLISEVSQERIRDEIDKMLTRNHPIKALNLLHEAGLLNLVVPSSFLKAAELPPLWPVLFGIGPYGIESALTRLFLSYHLMGSKSVHKEQSEKEVAIFCDFLIDLRFPNKILRGTEGLIQACLQMMEGRVYEQADYRFWLGNFQNLGVLQLVKDLEKAEIKGFIEIRTQCEMMQLKFTQSHLLPKPLVSGNDLIQAGLKPGVEFRGILDTLYRYQLNSETAERGEILQEMKRLLGA